MTKLPKSRLPKSLPTKGLVFYVSLGKTKRVYKPFSRIAKLFMEVIQ